MSLYNYLPLAIIILMILGVIYFAYSLLLIGNTLYEIPSGTNLTLTGLCLHNEFGFNMTNQEIVNTYANSSTLSSIHDQIAGCFVKIR